MDDMMAPWPAALNDEIRVTLIDHHAARRATMHDLAGEPLFNLPATHRRARERYR